MVNDCQWTVGLQHATSLDVRLNSGRHLQLTEKARHELPDYVSTPGMQAWAWHGGSPHVAATGRARCKEWQTAPSQEQHTGAAADADAEWAADIAAKPKKPRGVAPTSLGAKERAPWGQTWKEVRQDSQGIQITIPDLRETFLDMKFGDRPSATWGRQT